MTGSHWRILSKGGPQCHLGFTKTLRLWVGFDRSEGVKGNKLEAGDQLRDSARGQGTQMMTPYTGARTAERDGQA